MSADLETRLRELGHELEWPPTPDLARAVSARLPRRSPRPRRRLVLALAAGLLLFPAAGAVAVSERVRDWLGLASVEVRRAPELPPGARRPTLAELGERVTLAAAARRAGFEPVVPPALGVPEQVRERRGVVTLVYEGGDLLLAQLRGRLDRALVRKVIIAGTRVRRVPGGVLLSGHDHVYLYVRPGGEVAEDRPFLAGDTLVVQRDGLLLRLEAPRLTPQRALALLGESRRAR